MITKPRYQDRAKLCYMDTDNFVIHIKTEDSYEDIGNDVENVLTHLTMMKIEKEKAKKKQVFLKMNQEERL